VKLLTVRTQSRFPKADSCLNSLYLEKQCLISVFQKPAFHWTVYRSADSWHLLHPLFFFFSSLISASLLYFCFPEWILRCFCISVFPNVCQLYHPFHPSLFSQSSRNHARNVIPFFSTFFFKPRVCIFRIVNLSIFQEWFSPLVQYDPLPSMIVSVSYFLDMTIF